MADLWIPGFEKKPIWGKSGGRYDRLEPKKVLLHTTEGNSLDGAYNAYKRYPPHIGVDFYTNRRWQHIPLNRKSYSLKGSESDDEPVIQIEICGFARETQDWSDAMIDWLASQVMVPIHRLWPYTVKGAPQGFHGANEGIYPYIASAESPIRFSRVEFERFGGIVGHQHAPSPDTHWDPGAFPINKLVRRINHHSGGAPMTPQEKAEFEAVKAKLELVQNDLETVASVTDRVDSPYEQVQAVYNFLLDRDADDQGLKFWVQQIKEGKQNVISLGRNLRASDEYKRKNQ